MTRWMQLAAGLSAGLVLGACPSDDDPDEGPDAEVTPDADTTPDAAENGEDEVPSGVTVAFDDGQEVGEANWECLGDPDDIEPTENEIEVSGAIQEFMDGDLDEVEVAAFDSRDFFDDVTAGPVTAEAPGDEDDLVEFDGLVLPEGQTRVAMRMTADEHVDTYSLERTFDPEATEADLEMDIIADSTADLLANQTVGDPITDGLGHVAGDALDCDGNALGHVIVEISTESGELVPYEDTERTFYFGGSLLPASEYEETDVDGRFLIPEIEPSEDYLYVQAWGYPDEEAYENEELVLLSELETTIPPDGLVSAPFHPLRGEDENDEGEE